MKLNAIIFGVTGMVGEGVLHECLNHSAVASVLVINRRPCGVQHAKLTEIIHRDFFDFAAIESRLTGYNAAFFCAGVSSLGMKAEVYRRTTYDLTLHVARVLAKHNPEMTFCYVSGAGTDSSETGRARWARVKGKTENDLLKLPFKSAFMFRPGYIQPIKRLKNAYKMYKVLAPLYPVWKALFPKYVCRLEEVGQAMIAVALHGGEKKILENWEIVELAGKAGIEHGV